MNQHVRDWLPDTAFGIDAINAVLAEPLAQWAASWFPGQSAAISHVQAKSIAEGELETGDSSATVGFSESGRRQILEASLDINLFNQSLRDGDRLVLTAFVDRVAQDLVDRFGTALGHAKMEDIERLSLAISLDGKEAMIVCVPRHAFVPALKRQFGPPRRRGNFSQTRLKAAGPIRINVGGVLGRAELSLIDLKGLSVGDVLILDRPLTETVELRLGENHRSVGHGRLARTDGRVSIRF